ncbi:MAG: hypothetical protein SAJ12_10970 [Jaaginema sp. PMC 1079.18]|nr:hypothetical protein [Jaaginema sp. PMC 1080.18]MEC4851524.1 hypothetical protein [Jaaginema sp. PMC 1079.18]MEC4867972.1 hypothetical protein [Jaaginema sp. PMC 1078.18]
MNRRSFIKYSSLGTGFFVLNLGLHNPQPVDAFLFFLLRSPILRFVLGQLGRSAFSSLQQRDRQWWDKRLEVQLAEREFIRRQFTDVTVAEVRSPQYSAIVAAQSRERLGYNAGLAFPRIEYDRPYMSSFSGPAAIGMAVASEYLRQNERITLSQIQSAILPRTAGGADVSDWRTWERDSFRGYPNSHSDSGVRIRYYVDDPRPGGSGIIEVTVNAHRIIQIPPIRVNFA